jgi:hypothetical protein
MGMAFPLRDAIARNLERKGVDVVNTPCVTSLYELGRLYESSPIVISDLYPLQEGSRENQRRLNDIEKRALERLKGIDDQRLEGLLQSYGTQQGYGGLWLMAAFGPRVVPLMDIERTGREQRRILIEQVTGRKPIHLTYDAPVEEFLKLVEHEVRKAADGLRTRPVLHTPALAASASTYRV